MFIDRDGKVFQHILAYLRDGVLPDGVLTAPFLLSLLREAEYFNIRELISDIKRYGCVAYVVTLKEQCYRLGPDYPTFRDSLIQCARTLASKSNIHDIRPLVIHNVASLTHCPCGAFPPTPEIVYGSIVKALSPSMADIHCPIPMLVDWASILVEDFRIMGYHIDVVRATEPIYCLGIAGPSCNYGEEPCVYGPSRGAAIVAYRVLIKFNPLCGPKSLHADVRLL